MSYDNLRNLVPKDKFDIEPISRLMEISEDDIQPILPELLSWIADMNWPVAQEMIKVLPRFSRSLLPLVKEQLQPEEKDGMLKYFIITDLIPELSSSVQLELLADILRIIDNPTDDENDISILNVAKRCKRKIEQDN